MPLNSSQVKTIPPFFEGKFLEFSKSDLTVDVTVKHLKRASNTLLIIEEAQISLLDSAQNITNNIGLIDTVSIENDIIEIRGKDGVRHIDMSIIRNEPTTRKTHEINLEEESFSYGFDEGLPLETKKCQLRKSDNSYFFNIQEQDEFWWPLRINKINSNLEFSFPAIVSMEKKEWKAITNEYGLEGIVSPGNTTSLYSFKAPVTDEQFNQLFKDHRIIGKFKWIKIEPHKSNYTQSILLGLFALLIISILWYKFKKNS